MLSLARGWHSQVWMSVVNPGKVNLTKYTKVIKTSDHQKHYTMISLFTILKRINKLSPFNRPSVSFLEEYELTDKESPRHCLCVNEFAENIKLPQMPTLCISQQMPGCGAVTSNSKISLGKTCVTCPLGQQGDSTWRSRLTEQLLRELWRVSYLQLNVQSVGDMVYSQSLA